MSERVVITAGGTREKIDDVRYVGNFSAGRLGHAIASIYGKWTDMDVTLLAPQSTIDRFGLPDHVEHESFMGTRDLHEKLLGIEAADIVFHSAAVSDYSPVPVEGKIRSDQDELVVRMQRNPKIISELRDHFGDEAKLIGFKLLSGADDGDLYFEALKQIKENKLDVCVANDLQRISDNRREAHVITPPEYWRHACRVSFGDWEVMVGDTDNVANRIANYVTPNINYVQRHQPRPFFGRRDMMVTCSDPDVCRCDGEPVPMPRGEL